MENFEGDFENVEFLENLEFEVDDCIVFIDPLDATRAFCKGNLKAVTTLITLVVQNKPVIGLISYGYPVTGKTFEPIVYWGVKGLGKVYGMSVDEDYKSLEIVEEYGKFEDREIERK